MACQLTSINLARVLEPMLRDDQVSNSDLQKRSRTFDFETAESILTKQTIEKANNIFDGVLLFSCFKIIVENAVQSKQTDGSPLMHPIQIEKRYSTGYNNYGLRSIFLSGLLTYILKCLNGCLFVMV